MRIDIGKSSVWDALLLKVSALAKAYAKVGFLDGQRHGEDDITTVELALIHELGAPSVGIPERSFLRRTFEIKASELAKLQGKLVKGVLDGKITPEGAADLLGAWGAREVQNFIRENKVQPPTTEASTIAKNLRAGQPPEAKGTTLVDTGRLLNAITWEVGG